MRGQLICCLQCLKDRVFFSGIPSLINHTYYSDTPPPPKKNKKKKERIVQTVLPPRVKVRLHHLYLLLFLIRIQARNEFLQQWYENRAFELPRRIPIFATARFPETKVCKQMRKKCVGWALKNGVWKAKQDHQWWRYHRRLLDYQTPYFQLIIE